MCLLYERTPARLRERFVLFMYNRAGNLSSGYKDLIEVGGRTVTSLQQNVDTALTSVL